MDIVYDGTNDLAQLRVRRTFSLAAPQPQQENARGAHERTDSTMQKDARNGAVNGRHHSGHQNGPLHAGDDRIDGLLQFVVWAKDVISSQRKGIDKVIASVTRMEQDMSTLRDQFSRVKADAGRPVVNRQSDASRGDIGELQEDIRMIRADQEAMYSMISGSKDGTGMSSEELEVITTSIMTLNQKVNEVENLRLETHLIKGRLRRCEEAARDFKPSESRALEATPAPSDTPMRPPGRSGSVMPSFSRQHESTPLQRQIRHSSVMPPPSRVLSYAEAPTLSPRVVQNQGQLSQKRKSDVLEDPEHRRQSYPQRSSSALGSRGDEERSIQQKRQVPDSSSEQRDRTSYPPPIARHPSTSQNPSGLSGASVVDNTSVKDGDFAEMIEHQPKRRSYGVSGAAPPPRRVYRKYKEPQELGQHREANSSEEGRNMGDESHSQRLSSNGQRDTTQARTGGNSKERPKDPKADDPNTIDFNDFMDTNGSESDTSEYRPSNPINLNADGTQRVTRRRTMPAGSTSATRSSPPAALPQRRSRSRATSKENGARGHSERSTSETKDGGSAEKKRSNYLNLKAFHDRRRAEAEAKGERVPRGWVAAKEKEKAEQAARDADAKADGLEGEEEARGKKQGEEAEKKEDEQKEKEKAVAPRAKMLVLDSVEGEVRGGDGLAETEEEKEEKKKKRELEAREQLVRETLEREMEG